MDKQRLSTRWSYTFCEYTTRSIHTHGMKASPMSNRALHSSNRHTLFRWDWDSNHYVPLMWPYHLHLLQKIRLMSSLKPTRIKNSLNAFNTSASKSMTYWIESMLSTSNVVISTGCHTSSRWATKFGYISRRSASLGPTASFARSDMGLTPSLRLCGTMLSSSAFYHSLGCTLCSMWTAFNHTFHHYWTHQTLQSSSHQ